MAGQAKTSKSRKKQLFTDLPVSDLIATVDHIFLTFGIDDAIFRNPSSMSEKKEKVSGLTHIYLRPVRIGRKAVLRNAEFYYGRKIDLLPHPYEIVSFDAPADILLFMQERIKDNSSDYFSIHSGHQRVDADIRHGEIINCGRIGFDQEYPLLFKGGILTEKHLSEIIAGLI